MEAAEKLVSTPAPKKRNRIFIIGIILAFLAGMFMLLYPSLSNYLAQVNVVSGAVTYNEQIEQLSAAEIAEQWQKAKDYNDSLRGDPVKDPFVPGSGVALPTNYLEVLNVGDGIMGYVSIPKIHVYLPIRHGTSDTVLESGAGHIQQTSLPIGGLGCHSVVTAHTGYSRAQMFNDLVELEIGDKFVYQILDETITYRVDQIQVIEPEEIEQLRAVEGQDYSTLVTCTPYGVNSHRLLIRGVRTANDPELVNTAEKQALVPWQSILIAAACLAALFLVIIVVQRRNKKKQ